MGQSSETSFLLTKLNGEITLAELIHINFQQVFCQLQGLWLFALCSLWSAVDFWMVSEEICRIRSSLWTDVKVNKLKGKSYIWSFQAQSTVVEE